MSNIQKYKTRFNPLSAKEILDLYIDFAGQLESRFNPDVFLGGEFASDGRFDPSWRFNRFIEDELKKNPLFDKYDKKPYSLPYGRGVEIFDERMKSSLENSSGYLNKNLERFLGREVSEQRLYIFFPWGSAEDYYHPKCFEKVLRFKGVPKTVITPLSFLWESKQSFDGRCNVEKVAKEIGGNLVRINPEGTNIENLGPSNLYYYGNRFFVVADKNKVNRFGNNEKVLTMNFGYGITTKDTDEVVGYQVLKYNPQKEISSNDKKSLG